jgi:hypothetical protein
MGIQINGQTDSISATDGSLTVSGADFTGVLGFTGDNIRIGNQTTGPSITTGQFNFFVGNNTGLNNTSGNNNNFLGAESGSDNTSGSYNNFIGYYAGLFNISGSNNNFIGISAGIGNTTGSYNNFIGDFAGNSNTTGSYNIYVGTSAGSDNETGSENVVIGKYQQAPILNGSNQLVIGAGSTSWITGNSSYNVGIGTTNPTSRLEIGGNSSSEALVTFNRVPVQTTNGGIIGELFFQNNADSVALISVKRESAADDAYIQFATQQTSGGLNERLRIDSSGRVTTPYQ